MTGPRLSVIPAGALADVASGSLKAMDLRVLCALGTFTNESGWAKVRQETLADRAGTAREVVSRSMGRLVAHGWVEKHAGKHRAASSSYRVVLDPKCAPPDDEAEADCDVTHRSHRNVTTGVTPRVTTAVTSKNDSSNDSPQSPQTGGSGTMAGQPASPANSGRAGRAGSKSSKTSRSKRRRKGEAEAPAVAPPELTVADLAIPGGAEGGVIRAALNGWQKPASVRPWIGRFRVVDASVGGDEPDWKLAVDGDPFAFAAVFTGAAIHLGLMRQGETLNTWPMAFAERFVAKGRGLWAASDPWGIELKPEVASGPSPGGSGPHTDTRPDTQSEPHPHRQDDAA